MMKPIYQFLQLNCLLLIGIHCYAQSTFSQSNIVLYNDSICYIETSYLPENDKGYICGTYTLSGNQFLFKELNATRDFYEDVIYSVDETISDDSVVIGLRLSHFIKDGLIANFRMTDFVVDDHSNTVTYTQDQNDSLYDHGLLSSAIIIPRPAGSTFRLKIKDLQSSFVSDEFTIEMGHSNTVLIKYREVFSQDDHQKTVDEILPKEMMLYGKKYGVVNVTIHTKKKKCGLKKGFKIVENEWIE